MGTIPIHSHSYSHLEAIEENKQSHQLQKEEKNVMSEILGRQNGRESDPSLKAWQEEQMQRRALVDKACAENRKGKEKGKKDQFIFCFIIQGTVAWFYFSLIFKGSPKILHHQRVFTYNKKHNLLYCLQPKVHED